MKLAARILVNVIRLLGLVMIVLGFQFWMGRSFSLLPLHMRLGEILVALLWILAIVGMRSGVRLPVTLGAIVYGIVVVGFGMTMGRFLPGGAHEIIRVLHLLIGLGAIGFAEAIGGRIKRA